MCVFETGNEVVIAHRKYRSMCVFETGNEVVFSRNTLKKFSTKHILSQIILLFQLSLNFREISDSVLRIFESSKEMTV